MAVIRSVVIMTVMEAEAMPMVDRLGLSATGTQLGKAKRAPCICYSGTFENELDVHVVVGGKDPVHGVDNVGTVPSALHTYLAAEQLTPDLIINAGTAGGFASKGAAIGDVFISTAVRNHDRRMVLPGFADYGIGNHVSTPTTALVAALGYKHGVVTTGNSLDHVPRDDEMMADNDASVKDMEAAAVAWSAELFDTPMFCVKVVTDIVDGDRATEEEFMENLGTAAASLQAAVPAVLSFVAGKTAQDL